MGTPCNSPRGQESTKVVGQVEREEVEAIVGCILAEEQYWRQRPGGGRVTGTAALEAIVRAGHL